MTSCVSESLQDWDIRTEPGDGGDIRPGEGGVTLSLLRRGRVRSSSSAELREEVPEPSVFLGVHTRARVSDMGANETRKTCLIWRESVLHRGGWTTSRCLMGIKG